MDSGQILTVVMAVIGLVGAGGLGKHLLDGWSERNRLQATKDGARAESDGADRRLQFADNEQARQWLREQLAERDKDLEERNQEIRDSRAREIMLMERVGALAEQVARQEERTAAQATQITQLQSVVAKWGADYVELKAERDAYRADKHTLGNELTRESLKRQMAEREIVARDQEIERLQGQIAAALGGKGTTHE